MASELIINNNTLLSFARFADDVKDPNAVAVLGDGGSIGKATSSSTWRARMKMSSTERQTVIGNNNEVRDLLINALEDEFGTNSFGALPKEVRKALKGTHAITAAGDFGFAAGKSTSGRPLTMRRIQAVINAVDAAHRAANAASAKVAKTKAESSVMKLKSSATTTHPEDFKELQTYFEAEAKKEPSCPPDLKGLRQHFGRGFTYTIGSKTLKGDNGSKDVMAREMCNLFKGHEKLLDIFDRVFRGEISTMESGHALQDGESFLPDLSANAVKKGGELEVSKNHDNSFRVVYRKKAEDIQSFTIWRDKKRVSSFKCKEDGVKGLASYEYSISFDMKLENGKPAITSVSDPIDTYKISVGSFKKMA